MTDDRDGPLFQQKERKWMVERQLKARGITDARVLEAMAQVPRDAFVPLKFRDRAYEDTPLPIGHEQTISQPYAVAFMVEALKLKGDEKVLEIGAGSGYQAAVLSRLAREVHTVERIPELFERTRERLAALGYSSVEIHLGDGSLGLTEEAPFDAIVVTASAERLPPPLKEQTAEGGCIVIPVGPQGTGQRMQRYSLQDGAWQVEDLGGFAFVPLIGEHGWDEE